MSRVFLILSIYIFYFKANAQFETRNILLLKKPNNEKVETFIIMSVEDKFLAIGLGGRIKVDSLPFNDSIIKIKAMDCFDASFNIANIKNTIYIRSNCTNDYNEKFCKKCKSKIGRAHV